MKSEETAELEAYVPGTDELAEDEGRVTVLGSGDPWGPSGHQAVGMSPGRRTYPSVGVRPTESKGWTG